MMNNTYSLIISQSERAWSFQWARTLFALERRLSQKERCAYLRLYSINMVAPSTSAEAVAPDSDKRSNSSAGAGSQLTGANAIKEETEEVPGGESAKVAGKRFVPALMIIKRMGYTRAERRRLILSYWQVSYGNGNFYACFPAAR